MGQTSLTLTFLAKQPLWPCCSSMEGREHFDIDNTTLWTCNYKKTLIILYSFLARSSKRQLDLRLNSQKNSPEDTTLYPQCQQH